MAKIKETPSLVDDLLGDQEDFSAPDKMGNKENGQMVNKINGHMESQETINLIGKQDDFPPEDPGQKIKRTYTLDAAVVYGIEDLCRSMRRSGQKIKLEDVVNQLLSKALKREMEPIN